MDEQTREIRQILLGRTRREPDGSLSALPAGERRSLRAVQGVTAGWGALHLLGVCRRERRYRLPPKTPEKLTAELLNRMGRAVRLEKAPGASACLCRHLLADQVLLTVEREDGVLTAAAYTARGALAAPACRAVLNKLEKGLPAAAQPLEVPKPSPAERREERARQRAEKRAEKAAARAAKRGPAELLDSRELQELKKRTRDM